jgi:hypothetical protein
MSLRHYFSLGAASLAVLAGASSAQAAALEGRFGINPPTPVGGVETGIVFTGTGIEAPNGNPLTNLDFVPPNQGGFGAVVEINANPAPNGEDDFQPFVGQTGTADDLTVQQLIDVSSSNPLNNFIEIPGSFSVALTDVEFPEYSFDESGTTVSIGVSIDVFNLSDGSNDVSSGVGTFSVDFAGLTPDETRALFDEPGETPEEFNPGTWSSNFVVTAEDVPPPPPGEVVPEASNLLGLLVFGLGGATMLLRKNKFQ